VFRVNRPEPRRRRQRQHRALHQSLLHAELLVEIAGDTIWIRA
jgi:hypothetical protein